MKEKSKVEMFKNPYPARAYCVTIRCPEFTSVCPRTGQPDFGEIIIEYRPDKLCIELKSLKFYMQSYRNRGIFYEALTNEILEDLSSACRPRWMKVTSRFAPRGGITTEVVAEYNKETDAAREHGPLPKACIPDNNIRGQVGRQDGRATYFGKR